MKNSIIKNMLLIFVLLSTANFSVSQNSNVWGSVKNLSELEKSSTYLTAAKKLNIKYMQALPSSKKPHLLKVYEFSCNCNEADLYTALNNVSAISGIEYGPKYEPLVLPDDYTMNFNPMWSLDLINAEGAWNYTHGDTNIVAAVSDQNYFVNHEELIGKVVHYDPANTSSQGHGTAVAVLVAGNTNNEVGMSSIGYDIKLGLYRMNYNEVLDAANAGAKVINMSWTSGCEFNIYQQMAIDEACGLGAFLIAAAGNGSTCGGPDSLVYPAAYDNVFAVTSIGPFDNHERYIGNPNSTHQHNSTVDLSAPGYDVPISAAPNWYLTGSGTSYASPIVAGTVGLMLSVNPCLSNLEIETYLKQSSIDIDFLNPNYAGLIGAGRLNAEGAVQLALNSIATNPSFNLTDYCEGENNLASNIATPGGTFSFDALPSSGESINSTTGEITGGISGTTYTIKYVTAGLCPSSATQTVTVNPIPIVTAGPNQTVCNDGTTVAITGSGAVAYLWDNGVTNGISFTPSLGTTTFTVIGTDANGCSNTDQVDVIVNDLPVVSAGTDQSVCNDGSTVTLSGSGAVSYTWDNGVIDGVPFTPTQAPLVLTTTYSVTGTDGNACSNTDQVDVIVNKLPIVLAGTDQTICNDGTTVTLSGSGASTYVWDNGVTDGVSFIPPLGTTEYTVIGMDNNGCTNTAQVGVAVNDLPVVSAGTDQSVCNDGTTVTLTGSGATTYVWNNGVTDGILFTPSLGTTAFTVTGTDANGCSNIDQVDLTVTPLPSVWAGLCQTTFWGYTNDYAEVELNGITSGGIGATTSVWTDQNGNVVGTGNPTSFLTNASTVGMGDYITTSYTLSSTDQLGCTESDDVEVTTYNVICSKPNANLNTIPNINNRKIMVCSKGGFRCVPYNAVANVLNACQNCKLGPCNAIPDCKGFAGKPSMKASIEKPAIKAYPNPSNGIINIVSEEQQTIDKLEVYSYMGELILTQYNGQTFAVNLAAQSTGIYLVKAYVGNQIATVVISYL